MGLALSVLAAALFMPFPVVVTAPLVVEPVDAQQVYVTTPGRLTAIRVRPGQRVRQGDPLVELVNRELADDFRELETSYEVQQVALSVHQATGDAARATAAAGIRDALYEEVQDRREGLARLTLAAPCDGIVVAPSPAAEGAASRDRAPRLRGTVLDRSNLGSFLPVGTHVLTVAPGGAYQAVLLVDQFSQADFAPGRRVRIKLEHAPEEVLHGVVASCSTPSGDFLQPSDKFSTEKLAAAGCAGRSKPSRISQATVRLDDVTGPIVPGLRGQARAVVFRSSLASWLWREARLTFSFL